MLLAAAVAVAAAAAQMGRLSNVARMQNACAKISNLQTIS